MLSEDTLHELAVEMFEKLEPGSGALLERNKEAFLSNFSKDTTSNKSLLACYILGKDKWNYSEIINCIEEVQDKYS